MEYIVGTITLQYIFFQYWELYCSWYKGKIRDAVHKNVKKILTCRTPQLGFHVYQCAECSAVRLVPHSCKSRFCSSCGKIATDKWTNERLSEILPVGYHHLVFTIPWQLRAICLVNRQIVFQMLFSAVSVCLLSWTKEYGGYLPGIYIVLHSFGGDLKFNPHFHVLMTAGGLSLDYRKWINAPEEYLMPEKGLKKRWKYNVIKGLIKANDKGLLEMPFLAEKGEYVNLRGVISVISKLFWYIYIGSRLAEVGLSVKYIGRYTKRPVIAETRIIYCNERWVIFKFKDHAAEGTTSIRKMGLYTFITYLMQHIPDKNFRVVRGYGLFSNRLKGTLLPTARVLLNKAGQHEKEEQKTWRERNIERTGKDPIVCENCLVEMSLVFVCYRVDEKWVDRLRINPFEKIPSKQIRIVTDTS